MINFLITVLEEKSKQDNFNFVKVRFDYKRWTVPLHVINSDLSPHRQIKMVTRDVEWFEDNIPIPEGVWPDPEDDAHMLLVDPVKRLTWDFYNAKRSGNGQWQASGFDSWSLDSVGYYEELTLKSTRGAGFPLIAGLIRPEQIEAGLINNALVCATPINRKTASDASYEFCKPASRTDGKGIGTEYIPEGARLQLNPNIDINTLELSREAKVIARAMQKYGMYVGDNAPVFKIYLQNLGPDGGLWNNFPDLDDIFKIPLEEFRVLKCDIIKIY